MNRLSRITFCLLLAGCATLTLERIAVPTGEVRLAPQWRAATGSNARTVEVFVENGTDVPLALSNLALDGVALPALPPERRKKGAPPMPFWWRIATTDETPGRDAPTARPKSGAERSDVSWKRPYQTLPPGGHAVIAVCFTNVPAPFELAVDANGERRTVAVPAPDSPWRRIADVAFASRGRSVFVNLKRAVVRCAI